jgi:hypothetical protein
MVMDFGVFYSSRKPLNSRLRICVLPIKILGWNDPLLGCIVGVLWGMHMGMVSHLQVTWANIVGTMTLSNL